MVVPISKILALQIKISQKSISTNENTVTDLESVMATGTVRLNDIQARINGSYSTIFSINSKLSSEQNTLATINSIGQALSAIITVITVLPIPTAPFPVTVGLITTFSQKLVKINEIINGLNSIISQMNAIINTQLSQLIDQKTRLDALSDKLLTVLVQAGVADEYGASLVANKGVDFVIGLYNDYKFYLKEEKVGSLTRHYAIAVKDGRQYYRTDSSFTLNPSILSQQLISKIQIIENKS